MSILLLQSQPIPPLWVFLYLSFSRKKQGSLETSLTSSPLLIQHSAQNTRGASRIATNGHGKATLCRIPVHTAQKSRRCLQPFSEGTRAHSTTNCATETFGPASLGSFLLLVLVLTPGLGTLKGVPWKVRWIRMTEREAVRESPCNRVQAHGQYSSISPLAHWKCRAHRVWQTGERSCLHSTVKG